MKYRILREDYYNKVGVSTKVFFTVQVLKKFLWFKRWHYIKTTNCYEGGCHDEIIKFNSMLDADNFINNSLKKCLPRDKWNVMVIKEID